MGAFGLPSAAYHWQRVAAAVVRLGHYLSREAAALFPLLFADDGLLLARGENSWLAWVAKLPADAVVKMPAEIRLLLHFFMGK